MRTLSPLAEALGEHLDEPIAGSVAQANYAAAKGGIVSLVRSAAAGLNRYGITANAVACMEELVEKYGPAPQAFLVVPIVGAFLIDFTNSFLITAMANMMR